MKAAKERDELAAASMIARQLHRRFGRLRSRVPEVHSPRHVAWRNNRQFLGQFHHVFVIEVRAGHMDQARRLLLNGFHDPGMAMPRGGYRDSGVEIEET